jgi:hypothetical protein
MPDEGASMKDQRPTPPDRRDTQAGSQHNSRQREQDSPMPEYVVDERETESETVIERAGQRREDGGDPPRAGAGG